MLKNALIGLLLAVTLPASLSANEQEAPLQVAVIDNGVVRADHLVAELGTSWDMRAARKNKDINADHGTLVASIIADHVDRPLMIHSFRVDIACKRQRDCTYDSAAIGAAVVNAMNMKVDLIQISIQGKLCARAISAIGRAANAGIQVVLSAGNDGLRSKVADSIVGLGPNVHVVGALDEQGNRADFTSWSRQDSVKLVMRQGVNLAVRNAHGRTEYVTGTSFAAPLFAAELLEAMPRKASTTLAANGL